MFLRDVLCICVLLHFSPHFYRCVESALNMKPQNVAAKSGEFITLTCSSYTSSKGNIAWSTVSHGSSLKETIYSGNVLSTNVSPYISVSDRDDGYCSLNISASVTAAKRYICTDSDDGTTASAELILLESMKCKSQVFDGSVYVSCSIASAGNWAPSVECKQWISGGVLYVLPGNWKETVDKNMTTRTWTTYISEKTEFPIICEQTFKESERPKETSATNVPEYFNEMQLAYQNVCVPPSSQPAVSIETIVFIVLSAIFLLLYILIYCVSVFNFKKNGCSLCQACTIFWTFVGVMVGIYSIVPQLSRLLDMFRKKESPENRNTEISSLRLRLRSDKPKLPDGYLVAVNTSAGAITVHWMPTKDHGGSKINGYVLEMKPKGATQWQKVPGTIGPNDTTYTVTAKNLKPGQEYEFRVAAFNDNGESEQLVTFQPIEAKNQFGPPGRPKICDSGLKVLDIQKDSVTIAWKPPEDTGGRPITGYQVEKMNPKTGKWEKAGGNLGPDVTEFKVPELKEGEEYKFRVKAENDLGQSEPLESEDATKVKNPFDASDPPGKPGVVDSGNNFIKIQWEKPKKDGGAPIEGYYIERKNPKSNAWENLNPNKPVTEPEFKDANVLANLEYQYRAVAVNKGGKSKPSEPSDLVKARPLKDK